MANFINSIDRVQLKLESSFFSIPHIHQSCRSSFPFHLKPPHRCLPIKSCISHQDIDMVRTKEGVYAAKAKKVVILWAIDNKPLRGPAYKASLALILVAHKFSYVIDMSAYANRHTFIHLPQWVVEECQERRHLDALECKGLSGPSKPYVRSICGRKYKTNMDLKKCFKQLHERERQKKLNRMRSLKGKKLLG